jgi:hypothetical protein
MKEGTTLDSKRRGLQERGGLQSEMCKEESEAYLVVRKDGGRYVASEGDVSRRDEDVGRPD